MFNLDLLEEPLALTDLSSKFVFVNKAFATLFRKKSTDLLGKKSFETIIDKEEAEKLNELIENEAFQQPVFIKTNINKLLEAKKTWSTENKGFFIILQPKKVQDHILLEQFDQIEEDYLSLHDSIKIAAIVTDKNFIISNANSMLKVLLGISKANAIGKQLSELIKISLDSLDATFDIEINEQQYRVEKIKFSLAKQETKYFFRIHNQSQELIIQRLRNKNLQLKQGFDNYQTLNEEYLSANEELTQMNEEMNKITERLKENEIKLSLLTEYSRDIIARVDKNGIFLFISPAVKSILGFHEAELLLCNFDQWVYAKDIFILKENLFASVAKKEKNIFNIRVKNKNQEIVWLEISIAPITETLDYAEEMILVMRDITKRIEDEEARQKLQKRYETVLENFPKGALFLFDEDIRYSMVAGKALEPVGLSPQYCIGKTLFEIFPYEVSSIAGTHDKKIFIGERVYYELMFKGNHYANWGVPIISENGKIEEGLVYVLDITEIKKSETNYRNSERLLNESQSIAKIGGWEIDLKTKQPVWTKETYKIFGVSEDFVPDNKSIFAFFRKKDVKKFLQYFNEIQTTHNKINEEVKLKKPNDKEIWVEIIGKPEIKNEQVVKIYGTIQDITEQKKAKSLEKKILLAKKSSNLKQQFIANVSHEMRTPMNGIMGMVDFLMDTNLDQQQQDYVDIIKSSSESLLNIINDVLDISGIEKGKLRVKNEIINIRELVDQVSNSFKGLIKQKNLGLSITIDQEFPEYIEIDKNRLKQILFNLLSNAHKYTKEGEISIQLGIEKRKNKDITAKFIIKDTGIGIKDEAKKIIFDSFTRIDEETDQFIEGSGLGLSIAKSLVRLLDGEIGVESVYKKGSEFWFTFKTKAMNKQKQKAVDTKTAFSDLNMRVLLAEDKIVNQKVLSLMLKNMNCSFEIANNGEELLKKFKKNKFDIILLDIMMPVMDGITALKKLKQQHSLLPPVIATTAQAMEGDEERFIQLGMDGYIEKPINVEKLRRMLLKYK